MIINFEQKKQVIKLSQDVTNLRKLTNQLPENSELAIMLTKLIESMEKRKWNKRKKTCC
jgi:hypothetical protein